MYRIRFNDSSARRGNLHTSDFRLDPNKCEEEDEHKYSFSPQDELATHLWMCFGVFSLFSFMLCWVLEIPVYDQIMIMFEMPLFRRDCWLLIFSSMMIVLFLTGMLLKVWIFFCNVFFWGE